MQKVIMTGRISQEPELKYGKSGNAYCNFSMAVNNSFKKDCDFFRMTAFGKTAENIKRYLIVGSYLCIEATLGNSRWKDENGEEKFQNNKILVSNVEFGPKKERQANPKQEDMGLDEANEETDDDDVPF